MLKAVCHSTLSFLICNSMRKLNLLNKNKVNLSCDRPIKTVLLYTYKDRLTEFRHCSKDPFISQWTVQERHVNAN